MDDQNSFNLIRQGGKMRDQGVTSLYRSYAAHFRKFYLYQGLNSADAEDIAQETFVNIVRHCDMAPKMRSSILQSGDQRLVKLLQVLPDESLARLKTILVSS